MEIGLFEQWKIKIYLKLKLTMYLRKFFDYKLSRDSSDISKFFMISQV